MGTRAAILLLMAACGGRSAVPVGAGGHGGATTTTSVTSTSSGAVCGPRVPAVHRPFEGPACPKERAPGTYGQLCMIDGGVKGTQCVRDSDCTQGINGRCLASPPPISPCGGFCSYDECFSDADCGGNVPCGCRSSASDSAANRCLPTSTCRLDADCGPGVYCSPSQIRDMHPVVSRAVPHGRGLHRERSARPLRVLHQLRRWLLLSLRVRCLPGRHGLRRRRLHPPERRGMGLPPLRRFPDAIAGERVLCGTLRRRGQRLGGPGLLPRREPFATMRSRNELDRATPVAPEEDSRALAARVRKRGLGQGRRIKTIELSCTCGERTASA